MDHPGMVARRMEKGHILAADFYGSVHAEYVRGAKVIFFDGEDQVPGTIASVTAEAGGRRARAVRVKVQRPVRPASAGMFDQGTGRYRGKRFLCRCCDDLAGAAGALAMLDELRHDPPTAPVAVLLTRAEEQGFVGAIAAARKPKLLRRTDRIIAIETSAVQPYAPQGQGPIIRVGDRTSIFHSGLTYFLTQQAQALAKADKRFTYQRALMPGGTCEATAYDAYGFSAASICVALGNYHNMDIARKRIGPEYIDVDDWAAMVRLFVHIARNGHKYEDGHVALKKRLEKLYADHERLLQVHPAKTWRYA
jgi:endoglucanase